MAGARYNYAPAPPDILARVTRIEAVCLAHGVKLIEAALQFVLGHPAVKTVIPGANSPAQVKANLRLLTCPHSAGALVRPEVRGAAAQRRARPHRKDRLRREQC